MKKLTIEFPDEISCDEFIGWFLDGGGEQGFYDSCEMHDIEPLDVDLAEPDKITMTYFDEE